MSQTSNQQTSKPVELFGWMASPYTAKVRSYLTYKNIPFKDNVPSVFTLNGKIKKDVGQLIMPVVYTDQTPLQDSTVILQTFEQQHSERCINPDNPIQQFYNLILEMFADEWLPLAALHYRWNYPENRAFIHKEFGKSALPYFPSFIQNYVAKVFGGKMSGYLPILGIKPHMEKPLEKNTLHILDALNTHLATHDFIFGPRPSLADFSLYGPIFAHLDRDPSPKNLVSQFKHVKKWVDTLNGDFAHIKNSSEWPDTNETLDSLKPLLDIWSQCHGPLIRQSIDAITQWYNALDSDQKASEKKLPKFLGKASITLDGQNETRLNLTYGYWMWSRIHKHYSALTDTQKSQLKPLLQAWNIDDLLNTALPCEVSLKRCRLYLVAPANTIKNR